MLEQITNVISLTTIITFALALIARFIPNDKIYGYGLRIGQILDGFGSTKFGSIAWEKIEDFLINSVGEFLRGFKSGLDDDTKD